MADSSQFPLPQEPSLSVNRLARIFDTVTMSYKFYWFLGLLDIVVKEGQTTFDASQIAVNMIANAWYPVNFFHISLGWKDHLDQAVGELNQGLDIEFRNQEEIKALVANLMQSHPLAQSKIKTLLRYVPHRFLAPWLDKFGKDEKQAISQAQDFYKGSLYRLKGSGEKAIVEINPEWISYLNDNYAILQAFAFWHLARYVQQRNPNIPSVLEKLQKPLERVSMDKQKNFWNDLIHDDNFEINCIYTHKRLKYKAFDLDHFIPWSFVAHNLLWNLIPADSSVNSSKSNKLPPLGDYLPALARTQQRAIRKCIESGQNPKVLEDFWTIRKSPSEIARMEEAELNEFYETVFEPLYTIADKVGFEKWSGYVETSH